MQCPECCSCCSNDASPSCALCSHTGCIHPRQWKLLSCRHSASVAAGAVAPIDTRRHGICEAAATSARKTGVLRVFTGDSTSLYGYLNDLSVICAFRATSFLGAGAMADESSEYVATARREYAARVGRTPGFPPTVCPFDGVDIDASMYAQKIESAARHICVAASTSSCTAK